MTIRVRKGSLGKLTLRLGEENGRFSGIILGGPKGLIGPVTGASADEVRHRLLEEAAKTDRCYFGVDGARIRFLRFFPRGLRRPRL